MAFVDSKERKDDFILLKKSSTLRHSEDVLDKMELKPEEESDEDRLLVNLKKSAHASEMIYPTL